MSNIKRRSWLMLRRCPTCSNLHEVKMTGRPGQFRELYPSVCSEECLGLLLRVRTPNVPHPLTLSTVEKFSGMSGSLRSSYEVKFSQWLYKLGIIYEYEPYKFNLSNGVGYVPDFYIPESGVFVEVKGIFDSGSKRKVRLFGEKMPFTLILMDQEALKLCRKRG
jgi:hypothetical protein